MFVDQLSLHKLPDLGLQDWELGDQHLHEEAGGVPSQADEEVLPLLREAEHGGPGHPDHPQLHHLGEGESPGGLEGNEGRHINT